MSSQPTQSQASSNSRSSYAEFRSYADSHYAMDWASVLRFIAPTVGLMAILGGLMALTLESGCTSKPALDAPTANLTAGSSDAPQASALQVSPAPASTPAYVAPTPRAEGTEWRHQRLEPPANVTPTTPPAADPVVTQAPTLAAAATTTADAAVPAAGTSYTVQHGDTLFSIAKQHYGNGKQWTRIASANPGLTPANLKSGQKIVLP